MAVIINDFEVVLEPPATAPATAPGTPEGDIRTEQPQPPRLSPRDLDEVLRQRLERLARVRAD